MIPFGPILQITQRGSSPNSNFEKMDRMRTINFIEIEIGIGIGIDFCASMRPVIFQVAMRSENLSDGTGFIFSIPSDPDFDLDLEKKGPFTHPGKEAVTCLKNEDVYFFSGSSAS